jgi:hypothetical protein
MDTTHALSVNAKRAPRLPRKPPHPRAARRVPSGRKSQEIDPSPDLQKGAKEAPPLLFDFVA